MSFLIIILLIQTLPMLYIFRSIYRELCELRYPEPLEFPDYLIMIGLGVLIFICPIAPLVITLALIFADKDI